MRSEPLSTPQTAERKPAARHELQQLRRGGGGVEAHGVEGGAVGLAGEVFAEGEGLLVGVVEGGVHEFELTHAPVAAGAGVAPPLLTRACGVR